jgi:hypothetical protein
MQRPIHHDALVRFRANQALIAKAEAEARTRSLKHSEFMRHAVRRELEPA